jgi:hypothetical protein
MRVERSVHGFLEQLAENMERTLNSEQFIAELERELSDAENSKDAAQLKQARGNAKRRERYATTALCNR